MTIMTIITECSAVKLSGSGISSIEGVYLYNPDLECSSAQELPVYQKEDAEVYIYNIVVDNKHVWLVSDEVCSDLVFAQGIYIQIIIGFYFSMTLIL